MKDLAHRERHMDRYLIDFEVRGTHLTLR